MAEITANPLGLDRDPATWAKCINLDGMSKADARVAIAKDVQRHINTDRWKANAGTYVRGFTGLNNQCQGCAMGALFYAAFAKFDGDAEQFIMMHNDSWGSNSSNLDDDDIGEALRKVFTWRQLKIIETAFEGCCISFDGATQKLSDYGQQWVDENPNDSDRLYAIMQNIIDNKGEFKIKQVYIGSDK